MDLNIGIKHPILAKPPYPPYTLDPLYSTYRHGRSNGWSFLTSTNLKPWTAPRNYTNSECLCDFRPKNANLTPLRALLGLYQ